MYLGYQNGKIKFYTKNKPNTMTMKLDRIEETHEEYILSDNGIEYIKKPDDWEEQQKQKERERLNKLNLTSEELRYALSLKSVKLEDILPKFNQISVVPPLFQRDDTVVEEIGTLLGYTEQDLDFLFKYKVLPY